MSKPAKCIPVADAKQLQDNWVSTRAVEIERGQGAIDTREFYYTVAELQEFLDYVRDQSAKQGFDAPGVRIYFGAYDSAKTDRATVFLAPTEGNTASSPNNYKIEPLNLSQGGWPPYNY